MSLSDEEFIKFIKTYGSDYYKTTSEVSKNKKGDILIDNDFPMVCLDKMKDKSIIYNENLKNSPKSVDGIFFNTHSEKFELYLVEFKGGSFDEFVKYQINGLYDNLKDLQIKQDSTYIDPDLKLKNKFFNDIKYFCKYVEDSIIIDLKYKIIESLYITVPGLYWEYKNQPNSYDEISSIESKPDFKEMREFLNNCDIYVYVFAEVNRNSSKRPRYNVTNKFYTRLKEANIISNFEIFPAKKEQFNEFVDNINGEQKDLPFLVR